MSKLEFTYLKNTVKSAVPKIKEGKFSIVHVVLPVAELISHIAFSEGESS